MTLKVTEDRRKFCDSMSHSNSVVVTVYRQEGLAVASIARDDPSPLPGMHRDHNALPSQTDRRILTS